MFNIVFYGACAVLFIVAGLLFRAGTRQIRRERAEAAEANATYSISEPKSAVEVTGEFAFTVELPPDTVTRMARMDWIAILEYERAQFRAENPHLFSDDWYEVSRREYSLHAIRHVKERQNYRRKMGLEPMPNAA